MELENLYQEASYMQVTLYQLQLALQRRHLPTRVFHYTASDTTDICSLLSPVAAATTAFFVYL